MIRIIFYLVAVGGASLLAAWFVDRPGSVEIVWLDHRISTSVAVLVAALVLLTALLLILWWIVVTIVRSPARLAHRVRMRRERKGQLAITHGLIAVGAGDVEAAARFAAQAKRLVADQPLTLLLGAQSAQLSGDRAAAETMFTTMTQRSDLKLLGLHGLFIEARRRNDATTARALAETAVQIPPAPHWAGRAVLEFRCASGDWSGALDALEGNYKSGLIDRNAYRRQRAVLLTARARVLVEQDRDSAKAAALEAVKLAPDLVPAATLAGRFLVDAGDTRRAGRVIEAAWRVNPHPDLAETFINLKPGDSAQERLARAEKLVKHAPGHVEGALALARAAIDAQAFTIARAALSPLIARPTQRVAVLMAELEEAETGDVGRSRAWMARALRAARDPAWTADGFVSDTWMPVSPATGRLDAFEWKVPVADLNGPVIEADRAAAAPEALPPVDAPSHQASDVAPTAPPTPAESVPARRDPPPPVNAAPPVDAVIPLIHAPDDPGPDLADEIGPVPEPRRDGWEKIRSFFR